MRVASEVYRLPNPERTLKVLDAIEAFGPGLGETSLFRRELVEVTLEGREKAHTRVYWLNRWHGPRRRIAPGDYARNFDR